MGFFDKINDVAIVDTFKYLFREQLVDERRFR